MRIHGSITALATPFTASGEVDREAWSRVVDSQLQSGTQGLVVAGSTGEAAALSAHEYEWLLRSAVEQVAGKVPVLAGTGLPNTAKTVDETRGAGALGADAALVVTPPYVRPTQQGLLAHYRAVAEEGGLPIVLYNVPGRTGCDLLPDTVAELAGHERIVGIKEARAEPERMQALLGIRSDGFSILSGDDPTFVHAVLRGADGVVSVASNVVPATFRRLCDLARQGNEAEANAVDARLRDLYDFLGVEPNPIPVKALLAKQGIGHGLRLPLTSLSHRHGADADRLAAEIASLELSCRDSEGG